MTGMSYEAWNGPEDIAPLNPFQGEQNIFLLKMDSSGTYLWHTFYGTWGEDYGYAVAVGSEGSIYISGTSMYEWNGPGDTAPRNPKISNRDFVIIKLNSSGAYQWHTFWGSTANDYDAVLALDSSDNIYLAGSSEAAWGTPLNPYSGGQDIVLAKLASNGSLLWHTFLGSASYEAMLGIDVDDAGSIYAAGGSSASWNGPAGQAPRNAHSTGSDDIVIVKLNNDGVFQWHTFLGSGQSDQAYGIKTTAAGDIYFTGNSFYAWNGPGAVPPLHSTGSGPTVAGGIVIGKPDTDGYYQWHTFYGLNTNSDYGYNLALDGSENLYVTGFSGRDWGETVAEPLNDHAGGGWNDIFLLKLAPDGGYQWHTFYGTANADIGFGIALDALGNIYASGFSSASWMGPGSIPPLNDMG